MPASSESVVAKKLTALQLSFKQQLPSKVAEIKQQWTTFCHDKTSHDNLLDLQRMVHRLAGSGGSFGAETVSTVAHVLLQTLSPLEKETIPASTFFNTIQRQIDDLIHQLQQVADK